MGDEREEADLQDFLKHMFMAKAEEMSAGEPLSPLLQNPSLVGSEYNGTPSFQRPPSRHSSTDVNNTGARNDTDLRHPSLYAASQEYHGQGGEARAMKQEQFYDDGRLEANLDKRSQSRQVQASPQSAIAFQPDSRQERFGHLTEQQSQQQQEQMRMQLQQQQQQMQIQQQQQQMQMQMQMQQIPQHYQMQRDQQHILQQTQQHHQQQQQSAAYLSSQAQTPTSNQPPMANFPMQVQMSPTQMPYAQLADHYAALPFHPQENLYRQEEEPHIVGLSRRARLRMLSGTPSDASESLESNHQAPHHQQQQHQPSERKIFYRRTWTPEEDAALINLVNANGPRQWARLAEHIPGKTGNQLSQRWNKALDPNIRKGKWSEEEDQALRDAVKIHGEKWKLISKLIPGRTGKQCRDRYTARLNPSLKTGRWTKEEQDIVLEAFKCHGNKWATIQKLLPHRSWYTIKWKIESLTKKREEELSMKKEQ